MRTPFGKTLIEGPFDATFDAAEAYCRGRGGGLFRPNNQEEIAFAMANFHSKRWFRIGAKKEKNSKIFQWINGDDVIVTKWGRKQPWYKGPCATLLVKFETGEWGTDSCNVKSRFLCEVALETNPVFD